MVRTDAAAAFRVSTWSMVMTGGNLLLDGKRRREARPALFDRVAVAVGQQIPELAHVRSAVVVAADDHRRRPSDSGEVVQLHFRAGHSASPLGDGVRVACDGGVDVNAGEQWFEA